MSKDAVRQFNDERANTDVKDRHEMRELIDHIERYVYETSDAWLSPTLAKITYDMSMLLEHYRSQNVLSHYNIDTYMKPTQCFSEDVQISKNALPGDMYKDGSSIIIFSDGKGNGALFTPHPSPDDGIMNVRVKLAPVSAVDYIVLDIEIRGHGP